MQKINASSYHLKGKSREDILRETKQRDRPGAGTKDELMVTNQSTPPKQKKKKKNRKKK